MQHIWRELTIPAWQARMPPADWPGPWVKAKLLKCRRCRLEEYVYAQPNETEYNQPREQECIAVHLCKDFHRAKSSWEERTGEWNWDLYDGDAICGYDCWWETPRDYDHDLIIDQLAEAKPQFGRLPSYQEVNCPDCLHPGRDMNPASKTG